MAQIVTITNPLTGQPAQVDQLDHTAQEIDDAIDRAKAGGGIDTLLAGKAPAGYGLGESQGRFVANASVDTLTKNGWYYLYDGVTGGPSGYNIYHATLFVSSSRSDLIKVQRLILATSGKQGYELRRVYKDTSWLPWEWIDPPMELGVEYRTTERYQGKPVYAKDVDCGVAPETGYIIAYPVIDNIESVIEAVPMVGSGTLPAITGSTANYEVIGAVQSYQVDNKYAKTVIEHNGNTTNSVIVRLHYTKTTD